MMRVMVDEGIGNTSPLWHLFHAGLDSRSTDIVWLDTRYPAMPDMAILDQLMAPDTRYTA